MGVELPLPKKPIADPNPGAPRAGCRGLVAMRALCGAAEVRQQYNSSVEALMAAACDCPYLVPVDRYQALQTLINDAN